jgi:hypothetical protein
MARSAASIPARSSRTPGSSHLQRSGLVHRAGCVPDRDDAPDRPVVQLLMRFGGKTELFGQIQVLNAFNQFSYST